MEKTAYICALAILMVLTIGGCGQPDHRSDPGGSRWFSHIVCPNTPTDVPFKPYFIQCAKEMQAREKDCHGKD